MNTSKLIRNLQYPWWANHRCRAVCGNSILFYCLLLLLLPLWALNQTDGNYFHSAALFCLDESNGNVHFLYATWILSILISHCSAFDSKPLWGCVHCHDIKAQAHNAVTMKLWPVKLRAFWLWLQCMVNFKSCLLHTFKKNSKV